MDIEKNESVKLFRKKFIAYAIQIAFLTSSVAAYAANPISQTTRYLDPSVTRIVVTEQDCFKAAPNSILQIEPALDQRGYRVYKVAQFFDITRERELYNQPLSAQILQHKIVAREFCGGVASIASADLPFTKGEGFQDANDGLLLINAIKKNLAAINFHLNKMHVMAGAAGTGTFSSSQLETIDTQFQAELALVNRIAVNAKFNGVHILDGSTGSINIPLESNVINIPGINTTTGSAGLNIDTLSLAHTADAQKALSELVDITTIYTAISKLDAAAIALKNFNETLNNITYIDMRTDEFIVQHEKPYLSSAVKK